MIRKIRGIKRKVKPIKQAIAELKTYSKDADLVKQIVADKFKDSIAESKGEFIDEDDFISQVGRKYGKYSLRTRIKNNSWVKSGRPSNYAIQWLYKEVFKDAKKYKYRKNIMYSGGLFAFQYFNPKFKNTDSLPYFDNFPLVLSLGAVTTKNGIRNLGFNLHYLPPNVRIIVLCEVFELYKTLYRFNIFFNRERPVNIKYQLIMKKCLKYGAGFAVKMYIPQRQTQIICFPYKEWYKAIFLPSRGYHGINASKMIKAWEKYVSTLTVKVTKNVDWRKSI